MQTLDLSGFSFNHLFLNHSRRKDIDIIISVQRQVWKKCVVSEFRILELMLAIGQILATNILCLKGSSNQDVSGHVALSSCIITSCLLAFLEKHLVFGWEQLSFPASSSSLLNVLCLYLEWRQKQRSGLSISLLLWPRHHHLEVFTAPTRLLCCR